MKVGDLVIDQWGDEFGIILWQVGCVDRWLVHWLQSGYKQAYNGCNLEVICE